MKETIRTFLLEQITAYDLQDGDDIFALGLVNSLFAMQLVLFVEQEFDISIDGEDLDFANFRTVNAIEHLVKAKTGTVFA
ncbi:MAG: phosphopantetheine-binding protein [Chloroflexi bacterium]|nr:phosphopantetheine-binding protein [Chloroflexota bacterium]